MSEPRRLDTGIRDSRFGEDCVVADDVNVYEATFGDRCFIGPFVEVQNDVVCGDNVRIQSHTLICERMTIGDDVFIGHGVMTANARYPRAGAAEWVCEPPVIGDRVAIGSNATILPGVTIGADAVVGAGAIVSKDVPPGAVVVGRDEILRRRRDEDEGAKAEAPATVPFLDLASQQAEVSDDVLPVWRAQFGDAAFIGGDEVVSFEDEYADYIGVRHCVGVANGTDALELAYRAAGVGRGDEVIIPANTFVATAEAVSRIGAVPVPVDVDERFLLIDPAAVEAAVTPRTRAIVPVHLYGQTAPVTELRAIAAAHDLVIVEDAAQAQGASSSAGRAGALGLAAATSFYPSKNLGGAGDGGAVLTDDDEVADLVRTTAAHGSRVRYAHDIIGINSRLDAVQAVVLRAKLRRLEGWNAARRAAAERYRELLADIPGLELPGVRPGNVDACHLYVVRVDERDRVMRALHDEGIGAAVHYPTPLHLTGAYAHLGRGTGAFPVTERAAGRLLSLPMFPHLTLAQQERVAAALARAVR